MMNALEGLELSRRLGDTRGIASSLNGLAFVRMRSSDHEAVRILSEGALAIHRELGDKWGAAQSLYLSGLTTFYWGDHATARPLLEEALILFREAGDREGIADSFGALGMAALSQGDYETVRYLWKRLGRSSRRGRSARGQGSRVTHTWIRDRSAPALLHSSPQTPAGRLVVGS